MSPRNPSASARTCCDHRVIARHDEQCCDGFTAAGGGALGEPIGNSSVEPEAVSVDEPTVAPDPPAFVQRTASHRLAHADAPEHQRFDEQKLRSLG